MSNKKKVGHFDICNAMSLANMDISVSPLKNITYLKKTKHGTEVTIGVAGDLVAAIGLQNKFVGGLMLIDREQYFQTKERLELEAGE